MPFYEYECSACKFYVEALQKISDPPMKKCPSCKKQTLKRLVSAPVFRLKGSGWYETDFKSDKENKRNLLDSGDKDSATESSSDSKSDSKSESKVESASSKRKASPASKSVKAPVKAVAKAAPKKPVKKSAGAAKPKKTAKAAKKK